MAYDRLVRNLRSFVTLVMARLSLNVLAKISCKPQIAMPAAAGKGQAVPSVTGRLT